MRPDSAERLSAPEDESTNVPGCGSEDRLAALITGLERPTAYHVDELLLSWRHAQQEATRAYARWHELAPRDGHAVGVAAAGLGEHILVKRARVIGSTFSPRP